MTRWLGAGLALLTLTACASPGGPPPGPGGPGMGPPPGRGGHGPPDGFGPEGGPGGGPGGPPRVRLFISPCGRPYRPTEAAPDPIAAWFTGADANKDGKLDKAEFRADADLFFRVLDRDHDGVVAGEEVSFYEQRIAPEILGGGPQASDARGLLIRAQMTQMPGGMGGGGMPGGGGGPPGGGPPGGGSGGPPGGAPRGMGGPSMDGAAPYTFLREPQPVAASDGNFDRRITAAEFSAAADRRFKLLDKDGDGFLTLETLPPIGMRGPGRGGRGGPGRGPGGPPPGLQS